MEQRAILLIDDDETICFGIEVFLQKKGYRVSTAHSLGEAKQTVLNQPPFDLVLLDWNLPDGTGDSFCSWIKERQEIPVIFLTVRGDDDDIVASLDMGADDYVIKPFTLPVLLSRINAVLRRSGDQEQDTRLHCGNISLDTAQTKAWAGTGEITLTAGEYRLLRMLLQHKNQTLTRTVLLERLWDEGGDFVNDNTLTVTMKRLREKLGEPSIIKTVRGIGYRAEANDE